MSCRNLLLLTLSLSVLTVQAEEYVMTNLKLFAGPGNDEQTISIRVTDGVIAEMGESIDTADVVSIDGNGRYVTPGLIDSGSTIGIEEVGLSTNAEDQEYEGDAMSAAFDPLLAYNQNSSLIPSILNEGVTHVQVTPKAGKDVFAGLGGLVRLDQGLVPGAPRIVYAYLGETGRRHAGNSRAAALQRLLQGLDEAVIYASKKKAYETNRLRQLVFSVADLEVLAALLAGDMKLAVYVDRAAEIEAVLSALADYELDVVLLGAREAWQVVGAISAADVPVVINVVDNQPSSFDRLGARLDQAKLLHDAGIRFAFMTEDIYSESRMLTQSAGVAVAYGLPWSAALAAITSAPAAIWGVEDSFGELAAGKAATFVLWDADPLEVTSQPEAIYIAGEGVRMENRQDMLRERYRSMSKSNQKPYVYR